MRKPLVDALQRSVEAVNAYTTTEGPFTLSQTYAEEIRRHAAHIEIECRGHLDDAQVYVAAHYVLVLSRSAVGRDGLSLLAHWLSPNLAWVDPPTLLERTGAWFPRHAELKAVALDNIEELSALVFAQALDAGINAADASAEYAEQLFQLSELRAHSGPPGGLLDFACFELDTPSRRALTVAVHNFMRAYPYYLSPLDTLEKVIAARPARALGVTRGDV